MQYIKILSIGKTKEKWLETGMQEYLKRLKPLVDIQCIWCKDDEQLEKKVLEDNACFGLDPQGKELTSEAFSSWLTKSLETHRSHVSIVIGGAEGLSPLLKQRLTLISFSRLTFTHQLCRLILLEQIYRAFEIARGSSYHK